ncbi:hypothetical protein [Streptomyces sp. NPDC007856]|uniref:hypothetical protein n=1 Tax=Streptomyces sp. NPDC007856 TaxID=3364781 RepID=UPI00368BC3E1
MKLKRLIRAVAAVALAAGGLATTSASPAQAASCVNPVALQYPVSLNRGTNNGGSQIGVLYLGYYSSCREVYAEFHVTNLATSDVVTLVTIKMHDLFTGRDYGYTQISQDSIYSRGGWADTPAMSIDTSGFYHDAIEPVATIDYWSTGSCGMVGWSHEFDNGQAGNWDTGRFGGAC